MKTMIRLTLGFSLLISFSLLAQPNNGQGRRMMAQDHFKKMDTDGDKKVTKEEWQKFHDGFFQELDKDADGSISFEELKEKRMDQKEKMKDKAKENKKQRKEKIDTKDSE
ncbi:hypothetical protein AB3N58_11570 [Leptospira sp. WS60.C2]